MLKAIPGFKRSKYRIYAKLVQIVLLCQPDPPAVIVNMTADMHLHPEKGAEQLHCNDIHSFCFYAARGYKQGV